MQQRSPAELKLEVLQLSGMNMNHYATSELSLVCFKPTCRNNTFQFYRVQVWNYFMFPLS